MAKNGYSDRTIIRQVIVELNNAVKKLVGLMSDIGYEYESKSISGDDLYISFQKTVDKDEYRDEYEAYDREEEELEDTIVTDFREKYLEKINVLSRIADLDTAHYTMDVTEDEDGYSINVEVELTDWGKWYEDENRMKRLRDYYKVG